jgi:hypothetical protein
MRRMLILFLMGIGIAVLMNPTKDAASVHQLGTFFTKSAKIFKIRNSEQCVGGESEILVSATCPEGTVYVSHQCSTDGTQTNAFLERILDDSRAALSFGAVVPVAICTYTPQPPDTCTAGITVTVLILCAN